jgi:aryl-alcohol dehydrogenase-like predicted oxidoreductase
LLIEACERSLQRLRQPALYGLLVHRVDDLLSAGGGYLVDAMRELQRRKRVEKIGVTVYTGEQIDAILKLFVPDIVQLPVSVLDQRLVRSGHLAQLGSRGVEIHARSVFLQGLLLMDPGSASAHFEPFRPALRKVRAHAAATQVSPLQLALGFVKSLSHIAIAIVGTSSAADLGEIVDAWQAAAGPRFDCGELACEDERLVNPALWIH